MRIIIGVDGSRAAEQACEFVSRLPWPAGTQVTLLGAIEPATGWSVVAAAPAAMVAADGAPLAAILDDRAEDLRRAGLAVNVVVELGSPAELLMRHADEDHVGLIVVGCRGLGPVASAIAGSVSAHLVDHAGCPVLVVRSPSATRMLVATDGSRSCLNIPRTLAAWGNAFRGLPVEVLSVAPRDAFVTPWAAANEEVDSAVAEHEAIAEQVADEMMELGWHAAATVRAGEPSRQIIDEGRAWGADLIVTGSRGLGTLKRIVMGSVAHDVLLHAPSSVLVVRGQVPAPINTVAYDLRTPTVA